MFIVSGTREIQKSRYKQSVSESMMIIQANTITEHLKSIKKY